MIDRDIKILLLTLTLFSLWIISPYTTKIPPLKPPSIEAHPGIMSTLYSSRNAQVQALLAANVPVIDFKFCDQDEIIYLPVNPRLPTTFQNFLQYNCPSIKKEPYVRP